MSKPMEFRRGPEAVRQSLAEHLAAGAAGALALRAAALALGRGQELSRWDDQQVLDALSALSVDAGGELAGPAWQPLLAVDPAAIRAPLFRLVPKRAPPGPAPAPSTPPAAAPRARTAPTTSSPGADGPSSADATFPADLDVGAMVAALQAAARSGSPFCEQCRPGDAEEASP